MNYSVNKQMKEYAKKMKRSSSNIYNKTDHHKNRQYP